MPAGSCKTQPFTQTKAPLTRLFLRGKVQKTLLIAIRHVYRRSVFYLQDIMMNKGNDDDDDDGNGTRD